MFLTPPDCPQSVAVLQIINSLKQLQQYTNHIFTNADQRLEKCHERINLQLKRIEVIEKKVETLEQVDEIPVFHCAPRYPELSIAGFCQPVFGTMIANISMQNQPNNSNYKLDLLNGVYKPEPLKTIKDGIGRKKNAGHFAQKSQKFDNSDLNGPLQSDAKMNKLNLTKLFTADMSRKYVSAQLDFSDSLLEGLETLSSSIGKETLSIGNNEIGETNLLATLECSQANIFDSLGEKVEFDLPEDLPVFVTKSLGARSVSTLFRSDEHLSSKKEAPKILYVPNESEIREQPKLDSCGFEDKSKNGVVSSPIIPSVEAASLPQIQAPPPPPPPPPALQQTKAISGRSDLMAAIRATGGVKGAGLKSVKIDDEQLENSNNKKNVDEEDLMTSLTRVLAMRRRGISGRQNPSNSKSMGDVLREHIPTRSRTGSSSGEDQNSNEVGPNEWVDE
uniref:WH2 domain-containing protein n=1 Tax=Meloidogyne enterolobii TaxID=390850 RepID=A0A6V7WYA3_MELEN|nr:unnamed protein product [Meloidogyne enterolobii]